MADTAPQSFKNHARIIPGYHMVTFGLLVIAAIWGLWRVATDFTVDRLLVFALSVATLLLFFYARVFALTVQDRVIRLEMRLRLAQVLPADLRGRVGELTPRQLVALRFASDEELPELTRTVLAENIHDGKRIKQMVRQWQADHLRA
jgi:hypothetical protein